MQLIRAKLIAPLTLSLLLACSSDQEAVEQLTAPVDVTLAPYLGQLVTVDAVIGNDTARLIFDTGGGETVVSPRIAEILGCSPSGRSVGYRMTGDRVDFSYCPSVTLVIGGIPLLHERIGIWDVQALLPEGVPQVDGVLSLKTLAARPFTLWLAERRLTLETSQSLRVQVEGMSRLHSRIATGNDGDELTVFVRGVAEDTAWFLVDSGNLDVVQVGPHLRSETDKNADDTWEGWLMLDGLPENSATFRTRDIIYDGVLSEEYLRQWVFSFDLAANRIWAERIHDNDGDR